MPKRPNVFGDSDNESEEEVVLRRQPKKLVVPKIQGNGPLDDSTQLISGREIAAEKEYMHYPIETQVESSSIDVPLFQSNAKSVGLSMMEKMGFKLGDSLGVGSGHALEPIKVHAAVGRAGIGAKSAPSQVPKVAGANVDTFRETLKRKQLEKHNIKLCLKLMKLCLELSEEEGKPVAEVNPLWRGYVIEQAERERQKRKYGRIIEIGEKDRDEVAENDQVEEKDENEKEKELLKCSKDGTDVELHITNLLLHLRSNYNYCYFCGCFYNDASDLEESCPGVEESDHTL